MNPFANERTNKVLCVLGQSVSLCAECALLALKFQQYQGDATAIVCGIPISNCVCRLVNMVLLIDLSNITGLHSCMLATLSWRTATIVQDLLQIAG